MSGKGSGRRPTNEEQYMNNWDAIFGKKKPIEQEQKKETTDELSEQTNDTDCQ